MSDNPQWYDQKLTEMRRAGASRKTICETLGVSDTCIRIAIRRLGLPLKWINPRQVKQDEIVGDLIEKGVSAKEIARRLKTDPKIIRRRMGQIGISSTHIQGTDFKEHTEQYLKDYEDGMSYSAIGRKHGKHPTTIRKAIIRRKALKNQGD